MKKPNSYLATHSLILSTLFLLFFGQYSFAQILVINEGSNRNYNALHDEDQEAPDWIELYNPGPSAINLLNYALSDDSLNKTKWQFPNVQIQAGEYKVVFCSGKDRKPISGFIEVLNDTMFNPVVGWNTHHFSTPFYWDGVSNILINTCAYTSTGYTSNSIFNQTATSFNSTIFAFQDGSPAICQTSSGTTAMQRPNLKLNNATIGTGTIQNNTTSYPAPYGDWYWASKHQILIRASELSAAGLSAGNITSLAFDVVATDPSTVYDYVDIHFKLVSDNALSTSFQVVDPNNSLHTNFKIASAGETVYLYSPAQTLLSSLFVNCSGLDNSRGASPDASANIVLFGAATPAATNNGASTYSGYLQAPTFSMPAGVYNGTINVSISNPNGANTSIYYTLDGSEPSTSANLYTGAAISIFYSNVLKARAFSNNNSVLPSPATVSSYLLGIHHFTPVLSVVTDNANLYGTDGIFDNWAFDWEKAAYVEYFDSAQQLIFSQQAGIQIDGGAGGSRSQPQHSFRVELDDPVLGEGSINYPLIPNRPYRTKYSRFYLRNGSNQYLDYPYKDACQVEMMAGETHNYYSAWRPVTVYINGAYFGLYELREKFDADYFEEIDNANRDSIEVLSLSYWGGGNLRSIIGSVDSFFASYNAFNSLNTADTSFWRLADKHIDMTWYNDYIIAESWMGNTDWPWNNIKIHRSDKTGRRWRFCVIDQELAMDPNGWTDCYYDHIQFMLGQNPNIPYINIWLKSMQNARFKNYFINRFADLMNTTYKIDRLAAIENSMFNQTVLEMPNEYTRWGNPNAIGQQMSDFNDNHLQFQFQLSERNREVRNHIESNFNMNGQVDITLEVMPMGAGKIKISTIVPDSLPWTGVYFNGNPVRMTAIPNPGFNFEYWNANNIINAQDTHPSINLNVFADATFQAVFTPAASAGRLAFSEVNYNSDSTRNAGNWIEFHNYGNAAIDISGWTFKDGSIFNSYVFPNGTQVQANQWVVLVEDSVRFRSQHPSVPILGQTNFGFSNSNETLSLLDAANSVVLSMHYYDTIPWPPAADGYGRTLELWQDTLDPNLPSSWFAGCIGGSPGGPYVPCPETISFSEINYSSAANADAGDWVEIINTGSSARDISGWIFTDSDLTHTYTLPQGTLLQPSAYLVLFSDAVKFSARFPNVNNKLGPFGFGLSSSGEGIRLFDPSGTLYQSMVYDNNAPWPTGAAGNGYTLEIIDQNGILCDGANWKDGCPEGSPGGPFSPTCLSAVAAEITANIDVKIYPNPSTGRFTLLLEGDLNNGQKIDVGIFNVLGESLYNANFRNTQTPIEVDLSMAPEGVYFLRIQQGETSLTKKIVLAR